MTFKLRYTDFKVSREQYLAVKERLLSYVYHDLNDALGMAAKIQASGGIAWEIESDGGDVMDHSQITDTIRKRRHELAGHPKVH